jgi:MFS family permease
VALAAAFSLLGDQALYAILPTSYERIGLMPYQVGLILSVNRWIRLATNQLAERLCRSYSLTLLLALSLVLGAALTALYGWISLFSVLLTARMLWGLCWSFIRQIGLMTAAEAGSQGRIGKMVGFYNGISRMGALGGNLFGGLGHDLVGYTVTMTAFGVLTLVGVPLGVLSRRHIPRSEPPTPGTAGLVLGTPGLWVCGFAVGCAGPGLILATLGLVLREAVGTAMTAGGIAVGVATLNGALLASRWVIDAACAPLLGTLCDRIGRRTAALLFFGLGAIVLWAVPPAPGTASLVVLVLLFYAFAVGSTVVVASEASIRGSRAVASYATALDTGAALGPLIGWMIKQAGLHTDLIFVAAAVVYAMGFVVSLRAFRS